MTETIYSVFTFSLVLNFLDSLFLVYDFFGENKSSIIFIYRREDSALFTSRGGLEPPA